MDIKVIRTEQQHREYLERIHSLMLSMPALGSDASDELELLITVVEAYENSKYPIEPPDPIDAITFRMHEKGLKQIDLVPYLGTRSRVSEILARKRPLTVPMIKALSIGLGISTDTLIGVNTTQDKNAEDNVDWSKFPVKEMIGRGWIAGVGNSVKKTTEELVRKFITDIGWQTGNVSFKRTMSGDAYSPTTKYALYAWVSRVVQRARERKESLGRFDHSILSTSFLRDLAQLSWFEKGPLLAVEFLEKHGIAVIIEPSLKGTRIDGAALKDIDGLPIIALTLRYDRLDNFWFTLLHEVAHIWKHVDDEETFLDDLDASSEDKKESEANRLAREAFIPRAVWKRSDAYSLPSKETIDSLSRELKINPAIIAGRIRRESGNYRLFADLIGQGEVSRILNASNVN
ncbi:ImmA/IrrE family metallo-endopeptidase [Yersinia enterocolitica]|uniref:ImmA/IrrE family metallo-endopeptidase n=1 Tax=Yersinia intermedia TaxID=631 RepID=A0ABX6F7N2_YERIN|nr:MULTISPECIES: ImmA/IrrE family metallo-endopeptidase [Enterobacterales]CNI19047.1 Predicted transcription regulator containing HTH domain [Yersinia frederiksenii]EKN3778954.1 ImmA/IrrE family metallo-endopeptidase [Yersinia enterocolitica]EKN3880637.1 ImmA/IrrE family metallo-endopeptidase [Yersinia enterocolitica]EKN4072879.1 ImmA/IrrE family metallo-endopeptidase [Yersinia enterocolitica]EKN4142846.1 ImmA/IrrE family metallo-endopeptidase [Yersinia enterocolitica]